MSKAGSGADCDTGKGRAHVDSPILLSSGSASVGRPDHMRTALLLLLASILSLLFIGRKTALDCA